MSYGYGYDMYIDGLILPITPGELTIKSGSTNETVTLINEGEINILKSPSLIEVSFEARFPMRDFPYSRKAQSFQAYFDHFKALKENKKPFRFIVSRRTLNGKRTWDTNLEMALEELEIQESADEGDDVIVSFELKQYKHYGVKVLATNVSGGFGGANGGANGGTNSDRETNNNPSQETSKYTVQTGDTLWEIAKAAYGDGSMYTVIYEANKDIIDNPNMIYKGQELTVPNANTANLQVQKINTKPRVEYDILSEIAGGYQSAAVYYGQPQYAKPIEVLGASSSASTIYGKPPYVPKTLYEEALRNNNGNVLAAITQAELIQLDEDLKYIGVRAVANTLLLGNSGVANLVTNINK